MSFRYLSIIKGKTNPELKGGKIIAVYILRLKRKVVYVGSSTDLKSRISIHKCYTDFDDFKFKRCLHGEMIKIERDLIHKYMPPLNRWKYLNIDKK